MNAHTYDFSDWQCPDSTQPAPIPKHRLLSVMSGTSLGTLVAVFAPSAVIGILMCAGMVFGSIVMALAAATDGERA